MKHADIILSLLILLYCGAAVAVTMRLVSFDQFIFNAMAIHAAAASRGKVNQEEEPNE